MKIIVGITIATVRRDSNYYLSSAGLGLWPSGSHDWVKHSQSLTFERIAI